MSPDDAAILLEQIVTMDCQMDTSVACKAFVTLATDEHSTFLDSEDNDPQKPGWCKGYCGRSKPIGWKASQVLEKMSKSCEFVCPVLPAYQPYLAYILPE
jgi:hypothetical protein